MKKYELLADTAITDFTHSIYRIRALKDVRPGVPAGTIGGYVESYDNLSQNGSCWIADDACVWGLGQVKDDALVCGHSKVFHFASITDQAIVQDDAMVFNSAIVQDDSIIKDSAKIYGKSKVGGYSKICDISVIEHCAFVMNSTIFGKSHITGDLENVVLHDCVVDKTKYLWDIFAHGINFKRGTYKKNWELILLQRSWRGFVNLKTDLSAECPIYKIMNDAFNELEMQITLTTIYQKLPPHLQIQFKHLAEWDNYCYYLNVKSLCNNPSSYAKWEIMRLKQKIDEIFSSIPIR